MSNGKRGAGIAVWFLLLGMVYARRARGQPFRVGAGPCVPKTRVGIGPDETPKNMSGHTRRPALFCLNRLWPKRAGLRAWRILVMVYGGDLPDAAHPTHGPATTRTHAPIRGIGRRVFARGTRWYWTIIDSCQTRPIRRMDPPLPERAFPFAG